MAIYQPVNEQLGYCFHPPTAEHSLGYPQLDVVIRPTPTGKHFDPESFTCLVAAPNGWTRLRIVHPWAQENTYRVCAGEIVIEDARPEQVKAFTFGGALQIDSDERRTICQLTSPTPLLEHSRRGLSLEEHLIEEVAILFAQRRAVQDDDVFDRRLAAADPLWLYRACLVALDEKFAHFPVNDDVHRRFKQFLCVATQPLTDEVVPTLAELL
ncbi:hypothetical protein TFLX_05320 [Thermoflexales bacterium]|nr:hypothetical protein TFLX_05320 [Thermoflexales bacterium]